eukprot:9396135-Pyramimonas_sp.AAC.1
MEHAAVASALRDDLCRRRMAGAVGAPVGSCNAMRISKWCTCDILELRPWDAVVVLGHDVAE